MVAGMQLEIGLGQASVTLNSIGKHYRRLTISINFSKRLRTVDNFYNFGNR